MSGTTIQKCICAHEYQDKMYGKGMRVHNLSKKGDPSCTVCGGKVKDKRWPTFWDPRFTFKIIINSAYQIYPHRR